MAKDDFINMRIDSALKEKIKKLADKEQRSVTNMITVLLLRAVK